MRLVNELENDLAFAVLVDKTGDEFIETKDVLPLIHRIREVLEPISERDHSYSEAEPEEEKGAEAKA
ncbi:MAG: hypothetical protein DWQ47_07135 [Acidobacteria bacterium]|nr:MAG: hypothetical protein DWQ32_15235 [Acidobacteriota bacterium]REJ99300.1 MAG: hypothetical protein DWQ38_14740 [Acidobacteriota bacterium]REK15980.1 MAG: hypothetical protein DWQ43_02945 [Acidobacteriota bacterium]REK43661.1 MAG: hypothetical protein DWQ47_07135 [Acidobacteriota bacterium]